MAAGRNLVPSKAFSELPSTSDDYLILDEFGGDHFALDKPLENNDSGLNALSSLESMSIIDLNRLAMHYLSSEAFRECIHLLKQAENVIDTSPFQLDSQPESAKWRRMQSLTINNIGCYYKKYCLIILTTFRIGKPNVALTYMLRALAIE